MDKQGSTPISPFAVSNWKEIKKQTDKIEGEIIERLDYIIRFLHKTFGVKLGTWYFYGAGEGRMGELCYEDDAINVVTELDRSSDGEYHSKEMCIIDDNGDEWMFDSYIPTRWLFEAFEQEIIDGKVKYEVVKKAKQEKEKAKRLQKKEEAKKLAESAKQKLTKAELAAIRKSL